MADLTTGNVQTICDYLAAMKADIDSELGTSASASSTPAKTAAAIQDIVEGLDVTDTLLTLLPAAKNLAANALADAHYAFMQGILTALHAHYAPTGLAATLIAADIRISYEILDFAGWLAGAAVFPPEKKLADYAVVSASGSSGTLSNISDVDTTKYGKANVIVKVVNQAIGATDLVLTLTMKKLDGTTEDKVVTVTGSSTVGTEFDVGTHDTDMYIGITAVSFTGGNDGDDVEIRTELERSVSHA